MVELLVEAGLGADRGGFAFVAGPAFDRVAAAVGHIERPADVALRRFREARELLHLRDQHRAAGRLAGPRNHEPDSFCPGRDHAADLVSRCLTTVPPPVQIESEGSHSRQGQKLTPTRENCGLLIYCNGVRFCDGCRNLLGKSGRRDRLVALPGLASPTAGRTRPSIHRCRHRPWHRGRPGLRLSLRSSSRSGRRRDRRRRRRCLVFSLHSQRASPCPTIARDVTSGQARAFRRRVEFRPAAAALLPTGKGRFSRAEFWDMTDANAHDASTRRRGPGSPTGRSRSNRSSASGSSTR